jgi:hypothetical protein
VFLSDLAIFNSSPAAHPGRPAGCGGAWGSRMADFANWATRMKTAFWPAGTFARACAANRRSTIIDSVAACVREIMVERSSWTGSAALLRAGADRSGDGMSRGSTGWPKNPRALAGRLRRAQTFLRALGIDISFSREGRAGSRIIRMHTTLANSVSTLSSVRDDKPPPQPADDMCETCPIGQASATAADDADCLRPRCRLRSPPMIRDAALTILTASSSERCDAPAEHRPPNP